MNDATEWIYLFVERNGGSPQIAGDSRFGFVK